MTSLTYLIYKENEKGRDALAAVATSQPSHNDRFRALFSSFRQKSIVVDHRPTKPHRASQSRVSTTLPKLRDLITSSGILNELQREDDLRSILEEEVDNFETTWENVDMDTAESSVINTLKDVMRDVLTIDDQAPLECTCTNGDASCLYHSMRSQEELQSAAFSLPSSRGSKQSSFQEIPYFCTPQFQPEYLTPMKKDPQTSTGHTPHDKTASEKAQNTEACQTPLGPPSTVEATSRWRNKGLSPEEDEDIMNSSHFQPQLLRNDSCQTYKTMVSEITLPLEMKSPARRLRLDPRAPQFQMAKEQNELQTGDVTMRIRNHSALQNVTEKLPPPPTRPPVGESPGPPQRKESQDYPTPKATSHRKRAQEPKLTTFNEKDVEFAAEESPSESSFDEEPPLVDSMARRGTIGGDGASQPALRANSRPSPSPSPVRQPKRNIRLPSTPQHDSNPLRYPADLLPQCHVNLDDGEVSIAAESIVGPFVSPSAVPRRFRVAPNTPQHDSNPLLFPRGIDYYPPSPSKARNAPKNHASLPDTSGLKEWPPIISPGGESPSTEAGRRTSSLSSEPEELPQFTEAKDESRRCASVRVKLLPREIIFLDENEQRMHAGLYSGPINRAGQMHGNGVFWFDAGDVYLGQFHEDTLHGLGIMAVQTTGGSKQILKGRFRFNEYCGLEDTDDDDDRGQEQ